MFYAWDITVPAGRSEEEPLTQKLNLSKGVVTRIDVKFPPGCHGLVKVRLLRYITPLTPLSTGEWITGDAETVVTECYYELAESRPHLTFEGCSPGTSYPHTVTVRVTVQPEEIASPWAILKDFTDIVKRLLGL